MIARTVVLIALAGAIALSAGCAAMAWTAAQFQPAPKVDAVYDLPHGKTVLVFVDDPTQAINYEPIKPELTSRINADLEQAKLVKATIPYARLTELSIAEPNFNRLAISQIGKKLGADQVLYVKIERFSLKDPGMENLWHGQFEVSVRVVDVADEKLAWPTDRPTGYPVEAIETPLIPESSSSFGLELARRMADRMADRVTKLFYKHTEPPPGREPKEDWTK